MNTEALEASWRQHAAGVRQLVRDLLGDPHAADDVVQETWLTALRRSPRAGWSWPTWLRGIAVHRARYVVRSERRRKAHETKLQRPSAAEDVPPVERFEQIELVVEALRQLSPRNREIVLLRYYEDLTPTAIAERLALPLATVKSRLQRSLVELRRRLEGRAFPAWFWLGGATMSLKTKTALAVTLLVIGTLGGGAWFALQHLGSTDVADSGIARVSELAIDGTSIPSASAKSARIESSPAPSTPAVAPETSVEDSGIRLLVVERGSKRPVPGAAVLIVDHRKLPRDPLAEERERFDKERDLERKYAPYAEKLVTDALGTASLPASLSSAWIGARCGELSGETRLWETSSSPLRLEVETERIVSIRVVDAAGAPRAGVPVGLRPRFEGRVGDCYQRGITNADGTCTFGRMESHRSWWEGRRQIGASFGFPMNDPPILELDLEAEPRPSRELVLPPTGKVRVRVLGEDGEPLARSAFVGLAVSTSHHAAESFTWVSASTWLESTRGEVSFDYVGLGLTLTAHLCVPGQTHRKTELRLAGPAVAGETIDATLRICPRHATLVGAFVEENGEPLTGLQIGVLRWQGATRRTGESDSFQLEADGRFRYVLDAAPLADRDDRIEVVSWLRSDGSDPRRMWSGTIALRGQTYPPGEHDLGQVVLQSTPPLASGVVVDDHGRPLVAAFQVERFAGNPGNRQGWTHLHTQSAVQKNGEFSLYGSRALGDLRVRAQRDGYVQTEPIPFVFGETGLRIVLSAAASVAGRVLLDEKLSRRQIQVYLQEESAAPPGKLALLDEQGRFHFSGLRPGPARARFALAPSDASYPPESADLFRIEGLALRAGESCDDERLREIDLRGTAHALRIRVTDRDGAPIEDVHVDHRPGDRSSEHWNRATTMPDGSVTLLVARLPVEVVVGKQGYRMIELPAVSTDTELILDRGIAVEIELGEGVRTPLDGAELVLSVQGGGIRRFTADMSREEIDRMQKQPQKRMLGLPDPVVIDSTTRFDLVLPGPDTYTAMVVLRMRGGRTQLSQAGVADQQFELEADASKPAQIRIEVAPERVQRALQFLKGQRR
jgi:RNA polymerase sigma factor (sigma-70 family)